MAEIRQIQRVWAAEYEIASLLSVARNDGGMCCNDIIMGIAFMVVYGFWFLE